MASVLTAESIEQAVHQAVRERIDEVINEEAETMKVRVLQRIRGEVGKLATQVLSNYEMSLQRGTMIIKVAVGPEAQARAEER